MKITFPDGSFRTFPLGTTGFEVSESISKSLSKQAIAMKINGREVDIYSKIEADCSLEIITPANGVDILRHTCAHLLAFAVKELFPEIQITIGPIIENGFFYDFLREKPFVLDDLLKIEAKMREVASRKIDVRREEWVKSDAIEFFKSIGEPFKAEIISSVPDETLSLYKHAEFYDLCRGPHAPNFSFLKAFKLTKLSGSYWRGDQNGQKLQRIYGICFATQAELEEHLKLIEEAEKRDHRKIGSELDLFHISELAIGSVFWHPKGYDIYQTLQDYIREKQKKNGYVEVRTPQLLSQHLWEKSGHWEKYRENMFISESEKHMFAIKPMNCPAHIEIFKQGLKSYRDLPMRIAEFGFCHRNEASGALHGIMRVRSFVQDDAHILCMESQIESEVSSFCNMLMDVYKDFGFTDVEIRFSTRPEKSAGDDATWERAESMLQAAVQNAGYNFIIFPGEGAFYGPKLEFHLKDCIGRKWQCGTIQLDAVLPDRLGAKYIAEDGSKQTPVILHRAILGTFERFIGILIENYAGKFPLWLAPVHVVVCQITNDSDAYAQKVCDDLKSLNIKAIIDISSEKIGYKIRKYSLEKIPYIITVGKNEESGKTLSVRTLGSESNRVMTLEELYQEMSNKIMDKR